jgi:hypothetical protein
MWYLWYVFLFTHLRLLPWGGVLTKIGKFWHRHRRPRPVTYNADPDFHSGVKQKETEGTKTPAGKRKGGAAAALRAQSTAADISEPQTPARSTNGGNGDAGEPSSRKSPTPADAVNKDDDDRAISPVSTTSSASEPPLAQKVKMNGNHTTPKRPTTPSPPVPVPVPVSVSAAPSTPVKQQPLDLPMSNSVIPLSSGPAAAVTNTTTSSPSRATVLSFFILLKHFLMKLIFFLFFFGPLCIATSMVIRCHASHEN